MTFLLCSLAAHAQPPSDLPERWAAVSKIVGEKSAIPVPFGADDLAEVTSGRTIARRYDTPSGAYATGAIYIDAPIEAVWIAINDGPHDETSRVSIERLASPPDLRRVYSRIDLPFPLTDRQLVVEIRTNAPLHSATGGEIWQRQWSLGDPSLAPQATSDGIWIDESRGAWTLLDAGEGTLALFSLRSVLGGSVPAAISQTWAVATLKGTLDRLARRAQAMPSHYVVGHEVVLTPAGVGIPLR